MIEAKLLGRNAIGVDINSEAVKLSNTNLNFTCQESSKIFTKQGNATELSFIKDESIDLICTHPPYANIIRYSKEIPGDISHLKYEEFLKELEQVAREAYRVLKKQGICTSCGKRPAASNKVLCKHCSARVNYRNRQKYLLNIYATKNICEISI